MRFIHVLTATHNNLSDLKKLLSSLNRQTYKNYSLTIVDDGSTDGTTSYLRKHCPSAKLLLGDGNLWWTGALNLGLQEILSLARDDDYILTINNDCLVSPSYLRDLVNQAGHDQVIGSKIISQQTGDTWDLGEMIDWSKGKVIPRTKNSDPVDALSTKGTLYPVPLFKKIGLLSNRLPHYISDYEISIRAKRHGYKLLLRPNCTVLNDTKNTGIGDTLPAKTTLKDSFKLMFSRKSKLNVIDQFWFITLSCPTKYQPINYLRLFLKVCYLLVLPFPLLHKPLKWAYNHLS